MLGEVYRLRRALEETGMEMQKLHPSIKPPGTTSGPIVRVRLAKDGNITALEGVTPAEFSGLWTHMDGNHNSFPVLRIREPLLLIPLDYRFSWQAVEGAKAKKATAIDKRREMQAAAVQFSANTSMDSTLELIDRIGDSKGKLLAGAAEKAGIDVIAHVCRAFETALVRPGNQNAMPPFLDGLRSQAIRLLDTCDESNLDAVELLLFTPAAKTSKDKRFPVQLALDSDDPDSRMYRSATRTAIALALLGNETAKQTSVEPVLELDTNAFTVACAFTGRRDKELHTESFPKVSLPIVATKGALLFTMNSAAPCNERYGQRDHALMPVSRSLVLNMQDALSHIVEPTRKGRTWRSIAGEKPDQPDLLIVYVDGRPDIDAHVADMFGTEDDQTEQQYGIDVKAVCDALSGIVKEAPDSRLNLFIIRKASEGQAFIALAETPTIEEVLQGAYWWQRAANNVPLFELPIQVQKQAKPEHWTPRMPSPAQVAQTLTQLWTPAGGKEGQPRVNKVRGVAFGEILNLMLQRPRKAEVAAARILRTLLPHDKALLVGIGGCLNSGRGWGNYTDSARKTALRAASLLGIALYALNSNKEDYVTQEAFRIGQMLALADRLHYCYCTVVRDKSYPPNLIGNAAFDAALDNPEQALSTLAARIRIYIGWAKTVQPQKYEDKVKRNDAYEARKVLAMYQPLASHFSTNNVPNPCDDKMRAQMLLGYLAGPDTLPQNTANNDASDQTDTKPEGQNQ